MSGLPLQAIVADNAEAKGLDVELAASGFGQQHQEVTPFSARLNRNDCA